MSYLYGKNGLLQSLPGNVSSVTFGGVNDASAFWVNGNKTFASLYEYTPTKNTLLGTTIDVLRNQIVDISLGDISPTFDADTDIVFWAATNGTDVVFMGYSNGVNKFLARVQRQGSARISRIAVAPTHQDRAAMVILFENGTSSSAQLFKWTGSALMQVASTALTSAAAIAIAAPPDNLDMIVWAASSDTLTQVFSFTNNSTPVSTLLFTVPYVTNFIRSNSLTLADDGSVVLGVGYQGIAKLLVFQNNQLRQLSICYKTNGQPTLVAIPPRYDGQEPMEWLVADGGTMTGITLYRIIAPNMQQLIWFFPGTIMPGSIASSLHMSRVSSQSAYVLWTVSVGYRS